MKNNFFKTILVAFILTLFSAMKLRAGEPVCHIMICCKECNNGLSFFVNGKWNANHEYADINVARDMLQKIKDAGINIVIIDMTNASQWTIFWDRSYPMVNNIQQVCREKNMQFLLFIGSQLPADIKLSCNIPAETDAFDFWNTQAEKIWNTWAQDPTYRKYGYGDDRPMIIAFEPSQSYWSAYNGRPDTYKTYLSKFYIGTTQVNQAVTPGETDGWGYRNSIQNTSGKIRYTSTNGGIVPGTWYKISPEAFRNEVQWASESSDYSVYGSYDDTCDGICWGIANTMSSTLSYNKYAVDDPFVYYNIIKKIIKPKTAPGAPVFLYSSAGDKLVNLDWADNVETDFADKYHVYRSKTTGGPYSFVAQTSVSKYADTKASNDTTWFYVVTAFDKNGSETGYSNEAFARPAVKNKYVYKFDFNTPGDAESWVGNGDVGGLQQATSLNGMDGVLKSKTSVTNIDPRLFYYGLLSLPADYKAWKSLELRVRQIGADLKTPQRFDPQGTIAYFTTPEVFCPGEIKWPEVQIKYEAVGEWITAIADISAIGKKALTLTFIDPIGNSAGMGKNFEFDYVYLTGYFPEDTINLQTPYTGIKIPGTVEVEDFDNGGVKVAYSDVDFENKGGAYRITESVDIGNKTGGGFYVGWCNPDEWLEYTVNVETSGKYKATIYYASASAGNKVKLSFNENSIADTLELLPTGGDQKWGATDENINLRTGKNLAKFSIIGTSGNLNLDKIVFSLVEEIIPGTGTGLDKSLWKGSAPGTWFKDSICSQVSPVINEVWADVTPGCGIAKDFWNARWQGQIEPLYSELYTFYLTVNDMGRVWINNQLVVDGWVSTSSGKTITGTIALTAGQKVPIKVDFAEKAGEAKVKLEWSSASNPIEVVPQSQLYPQTLINGISDNGLLNFSVYPNPATDRITIQTGKHHVESIRIIDVAGRTVYTGNESFAGATSFSLSLAKGIYLVKLTGSKTFGTQKLIIE